MHENGTKLSEISNRIYQSPGPKGKFGDTSGGGIQVGGIGVEITPSDEIVQMGITGSLIVGLGITFSAGYIDDKRGNDGFYGEFGVGWGLDASIGGEVLTHTSSRPDGNLGLNDIRGQGVSNNLGVSFLDMSWGGNDDTNMNFGSQYGSQYTTRGGGFSASLTPISFTQTVGWTGIIERKPKIIITP